MSDENYAEGWKEGGAEREREREREAEEEKQLQCCLISEAATLTNRQPTNSFGAELMWTVQGFER